MTYNRICACCGCVVIRGMQTSFCLFMVKDQVGFVGFNRVMIRIRVRARIRVSVRTRVTVR